MSRFWFFLLLVWAPPLAVFATDPPTMSPLGKHGETIYQTAIALQKPKKSEDRIEGGLNHVVFSLWLPEDEECIRGIYLMPFNVTGVEQEQSRAMCRHWKFALVGSNFMRVDRAELGATLLAGLKNLATQSKHPEIAHAPIIAASMSAGVGMCVSLAEQLPDRFIACGLACLEVGPETKRTHDVPMMSIFGERDGKQMAQHVALLPQRRTDLDASWSIAVQWNRKHEWGYSNNLFWPFFDEVIRQRLPTDASSLDGPVKLRPVNAAVVWYGNPATWASPVATIATNAQNLEGQKTICWLPGPQTAHAWQAFVVRKPLLRIVSPLPQGDKQPLSIYGTNDNISVTIAADTALPDGKIELRDGSVPLMTGELKDHKAVLDIGTLSPGIHTLIARTTSATELVGLSRPVVVLVVKAKKQADRSGLQP